MMMFLSFGWLWFVSGWSFVGDGLLCWLCLALLLRVMWVYEWCISSRVCIVVLSVCVSEEPSGCYVCGYILLRFVTCLCICDKRQKSI